MNRYSVYIGLLVCFFLSGCGYSFHSIGSGYSSVFIYPVENKLPMTEGYSSLTELQRYYPNIESKIREKLIQRFLFDGSLKPVSNKSLADVKLKVKLTEYVKEPVSYSKNDEVKHWRLRVGCQVFMEAKDRTSSAVIYGEEIYSPAASSEEMAVEKAVEELAKRVIDYTLTEW